ncbi:MAG: hypothetical protein J3Q66DRAFT_353531 [Benniella sp.]|nr:MAG: hypothetical protein J3Q66DRAFT_353531 [Benniella sp.]
MCSHFSGFSHDQDQPEGVGHATELDLKDIFAWSDEDILSGSGPEFWLPNPPGTYTLCDALSPQWFVQPSDTCHAGDTVVVNNIVAPCLPCERFIRAGPQSSTYPNDFHFRLDYSGSSESIESQFSRKRTSDHQGQIPDILLTRLLAPCSLPQKHCRDQESENGTCTEHQKKVKRPRKALQLQERLAIIDFWEENQQTPIKEISEKFNVPRTTVYGIINDKDRLKQLATSRACRGLTLERCSMAESRFRILEELLVAWCHDIRSRGFAVNDQKITAQAFEIHRMLSGLVSRPLPHCTFSPGWLQRFKERRNGSMLAIQNSSSTIHREEEPYVGGRWWYPGRMEDVYMCGITSMHSGLLPTGIYDGSHQESEARIQDAPILSVLLCCNATGTKIQSPHVFGRYAHVDGDRPPNTSVEISAGVEDLTTSELMRWLKDFDGRLSRNISLVVDLPTWNLLQRNPEADGELRDPLASLRARLMNITIVKMPQLDTASHPMNCGLVREFKLLYYIYVLGIDLDKKKREVCRQKTTLGQCLKFVRHAWFSVRSSTVKHSFEKIVELVRVQWTPQYRIAVRPGSPGYGMHGYRRSVTIMRDSIVSRVLDTDPQRQPLIRDRANLIDKDLSQELRKALPFVPDTVIQYYLTQEAEIGPSRFLRAKVQEMRHHEDFEGCFGSLSFGHVRRFGTIHLLKPFRVGAPPIPGLSPPNYKHGTKSAPIWDQTMDSDSMSYGVRLKSMSHAIRLESTRCQFTGPESMSDGIRSEPTRCQATDSDSMSVQAKLDSFIVKAAQNRLCQSMDSESMSHGIRSEADLFSSLVEKAKRNAPKMSIRPFPRMHQTMDSKSMSHGIKSEPGLFSSLSEANRIAPKMPIRPFPPMHQTMDSESMSDEIMSEPTRCQATDSESMSYGTRSEPGLFSSWVSKANRNAPEMPMRNPPFLGMPVAHATE